MSGEFNFGLHNFNIACTLYEPYTHSIHSIAQHDLDVFRPISQAIIRHIHRSEPCKKTTQNLICLRGIEIALPLQIRHKACVKT
jgi:hypothetical protein